MRPRRADYPAAAYFYVTLFSLRAAMKSACLDAQKLLYISMHDLTRPNGPGVNEFECVRYLKHHYPGKVYVLAARPQYPDHAACALIDETFPRAALWNLPLHYVQERRLARRLGQLCAHADFEYILARMSLFPWALATFNAGAVPLFLKTLGEVNGYTRNKGAKGLFALLTSRLNHRLSRHVIERASAIDCCTPELVVKNTMDFFIPAAKVFLVENGTNTELFTPGDAGAIKRRLGVESLHPLLGYIGGSPASRGGLEIIKAVAALKSDFPNVGALVVGESSDGTLTRAAKSYHVAERVMLPGAVSYEKAPDIIRCFDIGFALDHSERIAVTGNSYQKIRQYLACGKPVITSLSSDHQFVRQGLVHTARAEDMSDIIAHVRKIMGRSKRHIEEDTIRASEFAKQNLSTTLMMQKRLETYRALLG